MTIILIVVSTRGHCMVESGARISHSLGGCNSRRCFWRCPWRWRSVNCSQLTTTAPFHLSHLSSSLLSRQVAILPFPSPRTSAISVPHSHIPRKYTYFHFWPMVRKSMFVSGWMRGNKQQESGADAMIAMDDL